jgi:septum formation protein
MVHELLKDRKLVLASASPRRREIFRMLNLNPLIIPSDIYEPLDTRPPWQIVLNHAKHKAKSVEHLYDENTIIVAADTLVYIDKQVLGKPENITVADKYLSMLSGKQHAVYTGVCILYNNRHLVKYEKSLVNFSLLSRNDIVAYIKTKEPFDKAGAYGIQGYGSQFIKGIKGCYFNVMGFPVHLFYTMLTEIL